MRKLEVTRKMISLSAGAQMTIVYSITVDTLSDMDRGAAIEDYGICVEIPVRGESACLRGITVNATTINALALLVSDNLVTPCALYDVVDDWLCCK